MTDLYQNIGKKLDSLKDKFKGIEEIQVKLREVFG